MAQVWERRVGGGQLSCADNNTFIGAPPQASERARAGGPRGAAGAAPSDLDVFCITKRWMHSLTGAAPVLAVPHSRLAQMGPLGPTLYKPKESPMTSARQDDLRALADRLESMTEDWGPGFSYYRAAKSLRELAEWEPSEGAAHGWLWAASSDYLRPQPPTANRFFNSLPEMHWSLLVRFSRQQQHG